MTMVPVVTLIAFANLGLCQTAPSATPSSSTPVGDGKEIYHMLVMLPDDDSKSFSFNLVVPGIKLAVDKLTGVNFSRNIEFEVNYTNSMCDSTVPALNFIDSLRADKLDVVIGPACLYACAPVARYVRHYDKAMVSGGCLAGPFEDKVEYFLTRLSPDFTGIAPSVTTLVDKFEWKLVCISFYQSYADKVNFDCAQTIPTIRKNLRDVSGLEDKYIIPHQFDTFGLESNKTARTKIYRDQLDLISTGCRSEYTFIYF